MKKRALRKEFFMEIRKSLPRFLSILFIVALGTAFYSGIQSSSPDMRYSGDAYFDAKELSDIQVTGTMGVTGDDVEALQNLKDIETAEGVCLKDVLTSVGARQHRGIAKRMYTNFPQIFADGTEVDARSTVVIRCILSMTSECLQLQAMNPNLCIKNDASYHDMYYMNPPAKDLSKIASSDKVKKVQKDFEATHVRPERLMKTLFTDEAYVKANVDEARLMRRLFDLACNMQSHDTDMQLYSLFTDEECYDLWSCNNLYWYLTHACSPVTDGLMPYREADLLRNILDRADAALKEGKNQATLRFGHESCLLPLVALLELNHYGESYPDVEKLSEQWRAYDIFPMASNVQFVFFHKKGSNDVLVKVLLNEKETKLPVKTDVAPYYHWKDVESYYREKLDKYQHI